ncbi:helix-turn-helix domain-containing protein, partial [bacterium]|nr:helix-turn-helix domain-containing protein [bacterium]
MEELLIELGFNENEARLYEALLELSEGTVDEIARVARVRRPTAYKVLRSMVSRGLIAELPGRPIKYRMLDPEETLRDLFQRRYEEINKLREVLPKQFEDFLKQAKEKYRSGAVSLTDANKEFVVLRGLKTVTRIVQE